MRTAIVVAVLSVAGPLCAQVQAPLEGVATPNVAAAVKSAAARAHALQTALTAMNDGVAFGGLIREYMEAHRIAVEFATQKELVNTITSGQTTKVLLSDAAPAHPRVYAPLIAHGVISAMLPSVEQVYLREALPARVFEELGGEPTKLPFVDGDRVEGLQSIVRGYDPDVQGALSQIAIDNANLSALDQLRADPAQRTRAEEDDRFFSAYLSTVRFGRR
jgi:hypothetical protein